MVSTNEGADEQAPASLPVVRAVAGCHLWEGRGVLTMALGLEWLVWTAWMVRRWCRRRSSPRRRRRRLAWTDLLYCLALLEKHFPGPFSLSRLLRLGRGMVCELPSIAFRILQAARCEAFLDCLSVLLWIFRSLALQLCRIVSAPKSDHHSPH